MPIWTAIPARTEKTSQCECYVNRFRWLASGEVKSDAVVDALGRAAFAHAKGRVYCAIDGSSLRLTDRALSREIGHNGAWRFGARGLQAMTSVLMDEAGTPLGVPGVRFWARTERSRRYNGRPRQAVETEMSHARRSLEMGSFANLRPRLLSTGRPRTAHTTPYVPHRRSTPRSLRARRLAATGLTSSDMPTGLIRRNRFSLRLRRGFADRVHAIYSQRSTANDLQPTC